VCMCGSDNPSIPIWVYVRLIALPLLVSSWLKIKESLPLLLLT